MCKYLVFFISIFISIIYQLSAGHFLESEKKAKQNQTLSNDESYIQHAKIEMVCNLKGIFFSGLQNIGEKEEKEPGIVIHDLYIPDKKGFNKKMKHYIGLDISLSTLDQIKDTIIKQLSKTILLLGALSHNTDHLVVTCTALYRRNRMHS